LPLGDGERFDLIVGTNVFVYYDRLQQGLAMASAAAMLRPGGILLSNNALVEVPSSGMRSNGYSKTLYSNREEDGDLIIWYQKETK
jgi:chemotaxis methyl-accepting protein methylase